MMVPFDFRDTKDKPGGSGLLDELVHRLRDVFKSLQNAVTNDRLIRVTFANSFTDVTVRHGLAAPVRTWEVVDIDTSGVIFRSSTQNARPADVLILQASQALTATLRFT